MPELPEVETIARRLQEVVCEKHISRVKILREKSWQGDASQIQGKRILQVSRSAKILKLDLSGDISLLVHLKMTGQLIYVQGSTRVGGGHPTADWLNDLPGKHTRVILEFKEGGTLFFNDMRVFGWVKVCTPAEVEQELSRYAMDIIDPRLTVQYLFAALNRRSLPIKLAIMDNTLVSGVGNIYANDALHLAKVHPQRSSNSLSMNEVTALFHAMVNVVNRGIELGGATIDNYRTVDGLAGGYQHVVRVYKREGQACQVCGTEIVRIKQGGRSTYFCPLCQS